MYGPDSPAAARGLQQFFVEPQNCVGYLPLNTERPLFANLNMRKAVNYALDRTAYAAAAGPYAGTPFDQLMSPGTPGYEDIDVYPDHPDVERARDLAGWHPGDPLQADHGLLPVERRRSTKRSTRSSRATSSRSGSR